MTKRGASGIILLQDNLILHYTKGRVKTMKINCVVCKKPKLDVSLRELLAFVQWLEMEHTIPVCIECTDREIANLFLAAYAALSQTVQEDKQKLEEDKQEFLEGEQEFLEGEFPF